MYIPLGENDNNPVAVLNAKRTVDLPQTAVVTHFGKAFEEFIKKNNCEKVDTLHLETIAKDYPKLYTNENNKNRTLDKELAIYRNDRLLDAYKESEKRVIINGYKNIKDKQKKVIEEIEKVLKERGKKV